MDAQNECGAPAGSRDGPTRWKRCVGPVNCLELSLPVGRGTYRQPTGKIGASVLQDTSKRGNRCDVTGGGMRQRDARVSGSSQTEPLNGAGLSPRVTICHQRCRRRLPALPSAATAYTPAPAPCTQLVDGAASARRERGAELRADGRLRSSRLSYRLAPSRYLEQPRRPSRRRGA